MTASASTNNHPPSPIGIFDSGLGGLSVALEIRKRLPQENLIYLADSAHVPYGGKSEKFIHDRAFAITEFILAQGVKAIVIACNTATAAAAAALRQAFPGIPILGMAPAVKPAAKATKVGKVGVLATTGTIQSASYAALLGNLNLANQPTPVKVFNQAAPGLVECVEAGELDSPATQGKVASYVNPLLERGVDVIVLGCTHFPFLRPVIQRIAGPHVELIDTGSAVARHLHHRLAETHLLHAPESETLGKVQFFSTGVLTNAQRSLGVLWNEPGTMQWCRV